MGGAHAHGSTGHDSHGAGHGGHGGHDAHAAAHGGEIPPAPAVRSITPAPEDFVNLPGPSAVIYPVLWMALGALLVVTLLSGGWSLHNQQGHAEHARSSPAR
jgi:hypothetical protein